MKKENLLKALASSLTIANLAEEDAYLLCLVSKSEKLIIPLIRSKGIGSAYIDPDKFDDMQYEKLADLIECLNREKVFPIFKFTPKYKAAPEYSHIIIGYVKPTGVKQVLPKGINDILESEGYEIKAADVAVSPYTPRNYGSQIDDNPDFKMQYEAESRKLEQAKVTYESLPQEVRINYETVASGAKDGIIFVGPTGTGKTWLTMALANKARAHREDIQITPDTQVEDLVGKYVADDRPGAQSNWRFEEGPLLQAFYKGYVISIQEINYGLAGVNSCLNRYLDGTLQIKENGKVYHRHPNFVAYLTMNAGYEGTEPLNMALKNRFSIIQVPALTEDEFSKRLIAHSEFLGHKVSDAFCRELFKFSNIIEQKAKGSGWHENVKFSIRNATRFLDNVLLKSRSFEEFEFAIHSEYLNLLSCDNDNSEKLEKFKKEEEIVNAIRKIYDLYDFSEVTEASSLADNLDELFFVDEKAEAEEKDLYDDLVDGLSKRYKLD